MAIRRRKPPPRVQVVDVRPKRGRWQPFVTVSEQEAALAAELEQLSRRGRGRQLNPVSKARLLARLERLHEAVSRGLRRTKGPPSHRQRAIELAYHRTLKAYERTRRVNPVAKKRRKKSSSPKRRAARGARSSAAQTSLPGMGGGNGGHRRKPKRAGAPRARRSKSGQFTTASHATKRAHVPAYVPAGDELARMQKSHKRMHAGKAGRRRKPIGPESLEEYQKRMADAAYKRQLYYRRRKTKLRRAAKAKRSSAARKGAATRRRKGSMRGVPARLRKHPGLAKAWLRRHGRKRKGGSKRSPVNRWAQMSRGKRFGRKIRAAVRGYGRSLKLRSRATITPKEHKQGLAAAARAFRRQNPRRRRRNPNALIVNPRRRGNPMRRRRRRNPGGMIADTLKAAVPAVVTGAAIGALEAKVLGDRPPIVGVLAKVGIGIGAAFALKSRPAMARSVADGAFATLGYQAGVKLMGGVVGGSKKQAAKALAEMAAEDEETMGVLTEELSGVGVLQVEGAQEDAAAYFEGTEPLDIEGGEEGWG